MKILRRFVPQGTDPFSLFEYETRDVVLTHHSKVGPDGKPLVIFEHKGAEVPKHWSKNAGDVLVSKYFRRAGVPSHTSPHSSLAGHEGVPEWLLPRWRDAHAPGFTTGGEVSVKQVIHRIVGHWTYTGFMAGYFDADQEQLDVESFKANARVTAEQVREVNARAFYDEMVYMMLGQMAAPNSPQWFNTGLSWAYGISGAAQGHWYVDPELAMKAKCDAPSNPHPSVAQMAAIYERAAKQSVDSYSKVQAHACYILNVEDTMLGPSGIFPWIEKEARIFKFGSGSGANISKLRGKEEPLSGGGRSSGSMSWAQISDRSAGGIKSGGTTRRAAKMLRMDLDHPDIEEFINCKVGAELQVAAMHTGAKIIKKHCQMIMDRWQDVSKKREAGKVNYLPGSVRWTAEVKEQMRQAAAAGVPHSYIDRAVQCAENGLRVWPGHEIPLGYEDEAYATVAYQNANNSVGVPSAFYEAVDANAEWRLIGRVSGREVKSLSARDLEGQIAFAAWMCADPGVHFDTTINDWNVTPQDGRIRGSNPCSEHLRLDDSACNLASLNLARFMVNGSFDFTTFQHAAYLWQVALDITNTMAHLPYKEAAISVYMYRDTGLGYANLGAVLMSMGLAYDSEEGRNFAALITSVMHATAHIASAHMARDLGAYPRFAANKEAHMRCVKAHAWAARRINEPTSGMVIDPCRINVDLLRPLFDGVVGDGQLVHLGQLWNKAYQLGEQHGYRNAEMTVIAPTGTISIVMDCDTTGVEPMLGLVVYKTLAGGGTMVLEPSAAVRAGLARLGYSADALESNRGGVKLHVKPEHQAVFDTSFPDPNTGRVIPWEAHVKMMAAVQSFISGAISKTVNMPHDATVEDIKRAYRMGHDLGVKALAVYRDGSKLSQPLMVPGLEEGQLEETVVDRGEAEVADDIHRITAKIDELFKASVKLKPEGPIQVKQRLRLPYSRKPGMDVCVGFGGANLYVRTTKFTDGKIGEIWINYSGDQGIIQALINQFCKMANVALQVGVPIELIVKTMSDSKFYPNGMVFGHPTIKSATSIFALAAQLIEYHELPIKGPHEPKGEVAAPRPEKVVIDAEACPQCASHEYVASGTCKKCKRCGYSGGCG